MRIEVISPHGFCGGVDRAIRIAHQTLDENPTPVYCLHEIVHNESVVRELSAKGMRFVDAIGDVPESAVAVISAHGVSPSVWEAAKSRRIRLVDATCPFVAAVHRRIRDNFARGMKTVVIGEPNHVEVRGYLGEPGACLPLDGMEEGTFDTVVQTTLDSGEHRGVCSATRDRQRAVVDFTERHRGRVAVGVLVVGSARSSNTRRLVEVSEKAGVRAWLASSAKEVSDLDLAGVEVLGVTSGASTLEPVLRSVVAALPGGLRILEDRH